MALDLDAVRITGRWVRQSPRGAQRFRRESHRQTIAGSAARLSTRSTERCTTRRACPLPVSPGECSSGRRQPARQTQARPATAAAAHWHDHLNEPARRRIRRRPELTEVADYESGRAHRLVFVEVEKPKELVEEDRDSARLVARFRAGGTAVQQETFGVLYSRYYARIYDQAKRRLNDDAHEAENVAHDVFETAFTRLRSSEAWDRTLRGWLFQTVNNLTSNHRRKHGRVEVTEHNALEALHEDLSSRAETNGHAAISEQELWTMVERVLPDPQREVLELRFREDLSTAQVAARLGRTPGAIEQAQHRALTTLRQRLEGRLNAPGAGKDLLPMRSPTWQMHAPRSPGFSVSRAVV